VGSISQLVVSNQIKVNTIIELKQAKISDLKGKP
jgi:hypothetical protein